MKKNPSVDDNPPHVLILNCTLTVNDLHLGGVVWGVLLENPQVSNMETCGCGGGAHGA